MIYKKVILLLVILRYMLLNGKLIRWNNNGQCYIGDSNNALAQLCNYADMTSQINSVNDAINTLKSSMPKCYAGVWTVNNHNERLIFPSEPVGVLYTTTHNAQDISANGRLLCFKTHTYTWFIAYNGTIATTSGDNPISNIRYKDYIDNDSKLSTYPQSMVYIAFFA